MRLGAATGGCWCSRVRPASARPACFSVSRTRVGGGPVAWGWCDPMDAPVRWRRSTTSCSPCGALRPCDEQDSPHGFLDLLRDAVEAARRPVVAIVEDAHWADEASLELLRLIGRRIHLLPLLLLVSYRDDEIGRAHPLRRLLGALATTGPVSRVSLAPLSAQGVSRLAAGRPVDAEALHRRTGGNPFFVNELLGAAADRGRLRCGRRPRAGADGATAAARADLLEAAAVLGRAEASVLRRLSDNAAEEAGGVHRRRPAAGDRLGGDLPSRSGPAGRARRARGAAAVELHAKVLRALAEAGEQDPARLAHHAEGAGDAAAALPTATAAARQATAAGSHREAALQYARALRFTPAEPSEERGRLLMEHARECAALDRLEDAVEALDAAAAVWRRSAGAREAACRARSALPLVRAGRNAEAEARCRQAIGHAGGCGGDPGTGRCAAGSGPSADARPRHRTGAAFRAPGDRHGEASRATAIRSPPRISPSARRSSSATIRKGREELDGRSASTASTSASRTNAP
jgi:tetratricopeptide (TPR) repeat protein